MKLKDCIGLLLSIILIYLILIPVIEKFSIEDKNRLNLFTLNESISYYFKLLLLLNLPICGEGGVSDNCLTEAEKISLKKEIEFLKWGRKKKDSVKVLDDESITQEIMSYGEEAIEIYFGEDVYIVNPVTGSIQRELPGRNNEFEEVSGAVWDPSSEIIIFDTDEDPGR